MDGGIVAWPYDKAGLRRPHGADYAPRLQREQPALQQCRPVRGFASPHEALHVNTCVVMARPFVAATCLAGDPENHRLHLQNDLIDGCAQLVLLRSVTTA